MGVAKMARSIEDGWVALSIGFGGYAFVRDRGRPKHVETEFEDCADVGEGAGAPHMRGVFGKDHGWWGWERLLGRRSCRCGGVGGGAGGWESGG